MHSIAHIVLTLPLVLASPHLISAQEKLLPVLQFNRLTTDHGLPINEIRSNVVRDRDGFIWVGTVSGLARFDGTTCKVYRNTAGDPHSLSSNSVIRLFVDSKERLWYGTYASGPGMYDPKRDRFVNFLPRKNDSLWFPGHYVASFLEEGPGRIWMGFADGQVVRLDLGAASHATDADSIAKHARFITISDKRFKGWVEGVVDWDRENILVSTGGGQFLVNRRTREAFRPGLPRVRGVEIDTVPVPSFFAEDPHRLWIGTPLHGLYLLDRANWSIRNYPPPKKGGRIQCLQMDARGRLWVATGDGVDWFDPRTGSYKDYISAWGGPGKSSFTQMSVDSSGTLWVSTMDDGLYFLSPASSRFPRFSLRSPSGGPVTMETITPWDDGSYWMETGGTVANIRLDEMRYVRMVDLFKGQKSRYGRSVWSALDDGKGTLWFGTWGLGVYGFEPGTGRVRNFRISDQLKDLPLNQDVCLSLMKRPDDTLWIAANNDGLLAFDLRTHRFSRVPGVSMGQPWHLMTDRTGKIWVTDQFLGIFVCDPDSGKWHFLESYGNDPGILSRSVPENVYQDPAGRMWIGSKDLTLWEPDRRSVRAIVNATFPDAIRARPMGSDRQGRLWVDYVGKGLSILDPGSETFANFDFSDGLVYPIAMESLADGKVVLAGYDGLAIVHPESLFAPGRPPRLIVSRMVINDTINLPVRALTAAPVQLQPEQDILEFEFAAVDPGQGHLIQYAFRLEGLEHSWVAAGSRRSVRYSGLAPGEYVFRVKATSLFRRWPDQETAVVIALAAPWWKRTWFRVLMFATLASIVISVYRREVRRSRRDRRIQQEFSRQQLVFQESERKRVASEIHDGLGQDLLIARNELQQILQEKSRSQNRLQEVAQGIQRSIDSAREIATHLHPHHLDQLGFCAAIRALVRTSAHSSNVNIAADCDDVDGALPKDAQLHLYRIIQESVANAVRHAGAKQIRVAVRHEGGAVHARIHDDGRGFAVGDFAGPRMVVAAEDAHRGFGIASMSERARILGGTIKIESAPGSGTTVSVMIPHG